MIACVLEPVTNPLAPDAVLVNLGVVAQQAFRRGRSRSSETIEEQRYPRVARVAKSAAGYKEIGRNPLIGDQRLTRISARRNLRNAAPDLA
jgi:hypothetical protein